MTLVWAHRKEIQGNLITHFSRRSDQVVQSPIHWHEYICQAGTKAVKWNHAISIPKVKNWSIGRQSLACINWQDFPIFVIYCSSAFNLCFLQVCDFRHLADIHLSFCMTHRLSYSPVELAFENIPLDFYFVWVRWVWRWSSFGILFWANIGAQIFRTFVHLRSLTVKINAKAIPIVHSLTCM